MRMRVVAATVAMVIGCSTMAAAQRHVRSIVAHDEPIADQLLPTDDVVRMTQNLDVVEPDRVATVSETIAGATQRADLVALVDVEDVTPVLLNNGFWIYTRMTGTVRQVFKLTRGRRESVGDRIELYINGGIMKIGHVTVEAGNPLQLPSKRSYLLFMVDDGSTPGFANTHAPLLIESNRLVDTQRTSVARRRDPLNGLAVAPVLAQIVRFASR